MVRENGESFYLLHCTLKLPATALTDICIDLLRIYPYKYPYSAGRSAAHERATLAGEPRFV
jgi:hypothetical protein